MMYQCSNLNYTKAQLFPTSPYQLSLDIWEKVKNLHPLSSNSSTQWIQRTHPRVEDNTRLELASTRTREMPLARGSSLLSIQQLLLTAVYILLHSITHYPWAQRKASELVTDWAGSWRELVLWSSTPGLLQKKLTLGIIAKARIYFQNQISKSWNDHKHHKSWPTFLLCIDYST